MRNEKETDHYRFFKRIMKDIHLVELESLKELSM